MAWTPYKNRMGARRKDGLYIRRAGNWYPWGLLSLQRCDGWDLIKKLTLIGTFHDQPLEQVLTKVDALLPLGTELHVDMWRYQITWCPKCTAKILLEGFPSVGKAQVVCGHCAESLQTRHHDGLVQELELLPERKQPTFTEVPYVPAVRD